MRINLYLTPSNPPASPVSLLGEPASSSSSSSASSVATSSRSSAPKPLLALCPNGELVLIELQGSLEMEGLDSDLSSASASAEGSASGGGQVVGEFSWGEGKEDKPTLLLSHHRLEGKLVTLGRPLAVLEKRRRKVVRAVPEEDKEEEETEGRATLLPSSPDLKMSTAAAGNPLLEDSDDDEEGADAQGRGRSISPTVQRMKRDHALDPDHNQGSSSSASLGPLSKKPKIDSFNSAPTQTPSRPTSKAPPPPTSSPSSTPQAPMRGSALDFSSPQPPSSPPLPASRARAARVGMGTSSPLQERVGPNDQEEGEGEADGRTPTAKSKSKTAIQPTGEETPTQRGKQSAIPGGARKRQTSTYYDVVCIVRKKVLFSKRPEPVVHGLGAAAKK